MLYTNLIKDLQPLLSKLKNQFPKVNNDINRFFTNKPKPKSTIAENTQFFNNELEKLTITLEELQKNIDAILHQIKITKKNK